MRKPRQAVIRHQTSKEIIYYKSVFYISKDHEILWESKDLNEPIPDNIQAQLTEQLMEKKNKEGMEAQKLESEIKKLKTSKDQEVKNRALVFILESKGII